MGLARRARAEVLAELVRRRRAPGPDREAVRASRLGGRRGGRGVFRERTRDEWTAFAGEHDCCLEPVLDLDEALDSELVARARDGASSWTSPASARCRQVGFPIKLSRTPAVDRAAGAGARRADTDEVLARVGIRRRAHRAAARGGRRVSTPPQRERRAAADARAGGGGRRVGRARSSTTCARACCPSRSRPRATWRGIRASSSSA